MFEGRGVVREVPLSLAIVRGLTFKRVGLLGRNATRRGQYRNGKRGSDARSFCPRREASALNRSPLWNVSPLTIARERGTSRAAPRPRGYGQFRSSQALAGTGNFAVPRPSQVRAISLLPDTREYGQLPRLATTGNSQFPPLTSTRSPRPYAYPAYPFIWRNVKERTSTFPAANRRGSKSVQ
jgi:hypothetical protein